MATCSRTPAVLPTLPMAWDGTILSLRGALADGDHIEDLTLPRAALRTFAEAHLSFGAQMRAVSSFLSTPRDWMNRLR